MALRDNIEELEKFRPHSKYLRIVFTILLTLVFGVLSFFIINKLNGGHQSDLFSIFLVGGLVGSIFFVSIAWLWEILP